MAKSKKEKSDAKARKVRELRHWLIDEGVWTVAQWEVYQLFTQRKEILADYVRAEGHTDWVWLEEGLSAALDDLPQYGESNADEQHAMYIAAFILAYNAVHAVYPLVRPPTWLLPEMALLAGVKTVPKDTAEVVRDMLLQGRDAEAMLLFSELSEGPYIVWRDGFFRNRADWRRGTDLLVTLPDSAIYYVSGVSFEGSAGPDGIRDMVVTEPSLELGGVTDDGASSLDRVGDASLRRVPDDIHRPDPPALGGG